MANSLAEIEDSLLEEDDFSELPPQDIVAYNELRSCADIFRMHQQGIIEIHPEFQRDEVWNGPAQTRFIDSLVKQLPIPSMCFAMDHKKQKWMVIDGLQRISTIVKFLQGKDWRLSKLEDIDPDLSSVHVSRIKDENNPLHHFYSRVENLSIPITVLRCDFSKKKHMDYLFTIFHRLNTGGMKLTNQEIRNCIYGGELNNLLKFLDQHSKWRRLNKMKSGNTYRFSKQEIILRFFAFVDNYESYNGHLAKFLNDYMHFNRNPGQEFIAEKRELFTRTIDVIFDQIFGGKAPSKLSITFLEGLLVGVGRNIENLSTLNQAALQQMHDTQVAHEHFSENYLKEGLSKKPRVIERLTTAQGIFARQ